MEVSNSSETSGYNNNTTNTTAKSPASTSRDSPSPTTNTTTTTNKASSLQPPPKKRARFSISSILGEDKTCAADSTHDSSNNISSHNISVDRAEDGELSPSSPVHPHPSQASSPEVRKTLSPVSGSPTITAANLPDPAKYNAFLAQFSSPDVAKLYRWPLLWNPFMGLPQGSSPGPGPTHPGLLRPPFMQPPPFVHQPHREKASGPRSQEEEKGFLEAGEIVRPVAYRSSVHDPQSLFKRSFLEQPLGGKDMHSSTSPGPFLEGRRDVDTEVKLSEDRKSGVYSEADLDSDMVEIEVEEPLDSDNENTDNPNSGDDSLRNCERKKKTRTVFSRSQIFQLETMFDMKRYLSSSERAGLAKALNMTETQVKIWFQNRRNKWKRQIAAEMEAANMSQVTGQRLMQLPYMYGHDELSRGIRSQLPVSPIHSGHPVVPPSVHHYYGGILRSHTS